jgi:AcrR family transcriptional regulator
MTRKDEQMLQHEDRRLAFVLAAYHTIAEKGFEGLRLQEIATQVGLNHATVYHYFVTKEALIQAVVMYVVQRLAQTTAAPEGTAAEQLRHHLTQLAQMNQNDPELSVVLTELALRARRDPAIRHVIERRVEDWHAFLVSLLEAGVKEGTWSQELDADAVASTIITLMGVAGSSQPARVEQAIRQLTGWLKLL